MTVPCILLVEDEVELAQLTSDHLERNGFKVLRADSVSGAFRYLRNQKFDCLIVDIKLKEESGERIIQSVRGDNRSLNHRIPIIVLSAYLDKDLVMRVGRDIQKAFVKPIDRPALLRVLQEFCGLPLPGSSGDGSAA